MIHPKRISSSFTLFFFMFVPVFWLVFFGAFTAASFIYSGDIAFFQNIAYKIGIIVFYLTGVVFLFFTLLRLKRVEIDENFVYVTNYFRTYRYPFDIISSVTETNLLFFKLCTIRFVEKGSFGKKIHFLESRIKFQLALEEFTDLKIIYEKSKSNHPKGQRKTS